MIGPTGIRATGSVVLLLALATSTLPARGQDLGPERAFLERLGALEGSWTGSSTAGWTGATTFERIARGSVVMSRTDFGEPGRVMVTMFHMDGDRLVLTHYCEAGNQPRLVAEKIDPEAGRAEFVFDGGSNLPSRDRGHMDRAVYEIVDGDTLRSRWTWYEDGQERWLETIELIRAR